MTKEPAKGDTVRYWPGGRGGRSALAVVISEGFVEFGTVKCVRIRKHDGGTDFIAATHVEPVPEPTGTHLETMVAIVQDAVEMTPYWTDDPATHQCPYENAIKALHRQGYLAEEPR